MATGTTRNKVALKPGFGLMGWIRLTNSGENLTGVKKGSISLQELSKHNKPDDCWIAIRGKVYNITRYLDYHPGGNEELMRGAGIDATKLFDEYHAWVNLEQLLAKCYIGPLKNVLVLNLNDSDINDKKRSSSSLLLPNINEVQVPQKVIPRFDWIQKKQALSIYFYTKSFCNPGIIIKRLCDKEYIVTICIGQSVHAYKFSFHNLLDWPPVIKINQETGKIEIAFEKVENELWTNYGMHEKICSNDDTEYVECLIIQKEFINHNTYKLTLRPKISEQQQITLTSIGYHYDLMCDVLGKSTLRSYTPIPAKYIDAFGIFGSDIHFLIKKYNDGVLSKYISERNLNEIIQISQQQRGSFDLSRLRNHTNIVIFAAGSGITPFCGLIDHLLERSSSNEISNLYLFYFNKTEEDIWCRNIFDNLSEKDKRFKVKYVLSEPDEKWNGEIGRITEKFLDEILEIKATITLICGPKIFNSEALRILSASKIETICFQG